MMIVILDIFNIDSTVYNFFLASLYLMTSYSTSLLWDLYFDYLSCFFLKFGVNGVYITNDPIIFCLMRDFRLIFGYGSRINNGTLELHHKFQELTNILLEKKDIELKNS